MQTRLKLLFLSMLLSFLFSFLVLPSTVSAHSILLKKTTHSAVKPHTEIQCLAFSRSQTKVVSKDIGTSSNPPGTQWDFQVQTVIINDCKNIYSGAATWSSIITCPSGATGSSPIRSAGLSGSQATFLFYYTGYAKCIVWKDNKPIASVLPVNIVMHMTAAANLDPDGNFWAQATDDLRV
ncbi:MAG: hypothetical protein JO215_12605 [Ktedonobacteraceae bacterium]|nr:hypothetical protein [Ktedonobacteraceae bacterium]